MRSRPTFESTFTRTIACVAVTALLQGCAHVYVDADGVRHVMGLVHLSLPPVDELGGQALRSRSVGLSLTRSEAGTALVLGYSDTTMAFIKNHSLVPARALRPDVKSPEEKTDEGLR